MTAHVWLSLHYLQGSRVKMFPLSILLPQPHSGMSWIWLSSCADVLLNGMLFTDNSTMDPAAVAKRVRAEHLWRQVISMTFHICTFIVDLDLGWSFLSDIFFTLVTMLFQVKELRLKYFAATLLNCTKMRAYANLGGNLIFLHKRFRPQGNTHWAWNLLGMNFHKVDYSLLTHFLCITAYESNSILGNGKPPTQTNPTHHWTTGWHISLIQPPVDIKPKVPFWPGQGRAG